MMTSQKAGNLLVYERIDSREPFFSAAGNSNNYSTRMAAQPTKTCMASNTSDDNNTSDSSTVNSV